MAIPTLDRLAEKFASMEGVGKKSSIRMAYSLWKWDEEKVKDLMKAIDEVREKVHLCPVCQAVTDEENVCPICADEERDKSIICVVTQPETVFTLEKVPGYRGLYHVLHGSLSPLKHVTPDKLKIAELLERINRSEGGVKEVILATDPNLEGEATASYLTRMLEPMGVKVTRLAYGIPVGADLEMADELTLQRAIEGRR